MPDAAQEQDMAQDRQVATQAERGALGHEGSDDYATCDDPGHWRTPAPTVAPAPGRPARPTTTRELQVALVAQYLYMNTPTSRKAAHVAAPQLLDMVADMLRQQQREQQDEQAAPRADVESAVNMIATLGHSCGLVDAGRADTGRVARPAPVWPLLALAGRTYPDMRDGWAYRRALARVTGTDER